jgi:hypothetical protein
VAVYSLLFGLFAPIEMPAESDRIELGTSA